MNKEKQSWLLYTSHKTLIQIVPAYHHVSFTNMLWVLLLLLQLCRITHDERDERVGNMVAHPLVALLGEVHAVVPVDVALAVVEGPVRNLSVQVKGVAAGGFIR